MHRMMMMTWVEKQLNDWVHRKECHLHDSLLTGHSIGQEVGQVTGVTWNMVAGSGMLVSVFLWTTFQTFAAVAGQQPVTEDEAWEGSCEALVEPLMHHPSVNRILTLVSCTAVAGC